LLNLSAGGLFWRQLILFGLWLNITLPVKTNKIIKNRLIEIVREWIWKIKNICLKNKMIEVKIQLPNI
jgi:hypothetical protein